MIFSSKYHYFHVTKQHETVLCSIGRYQSQFAVRNGKKSPNQETGLANRGPLEALIDTKLILND